MKTLEKIEKTHKLRTELHQLENEIREEQRNCKHEYKRRGFDSTNLYFDCKLCGHQEKRNHTIADIMKLTEKELREQLNEVEEKFMSNVRQR